MVNQNLKLLADARFQIERLPGVQTAGLRNGCGTKETLVTANELAERLGIPRQTVDLWARQKRIPFYGLGRLIKFDEEEVLAYFKVEADKDESFSKTTWETDRKLEERDDRSASRGRFEFHSYARATPERAGLLDCRSGLSQI